MPDEVGRERGHDGDESDGEVLGMLGYGLPRGVVLKHGSPEVTVGQRQAKHPLA